MAYAAVISLKQTIERLLNSSHISIVSDSPEIIEFAYKEVKSLQEILERLDGISKSSSRTRVNALDGEIREAVCKLEDVIETHVSNQIASQSESHGDENHPFLFSIGLQYLIQDILSFTETAKKMKEEYINELDNPLPEEEDEADLSSRIDYGGKKSKMVGLSDQRSQVKDLLARPYLYRFLGLSLVGMAGIGKTTLAKEMFEDPDILKHFKFRAWVTVGRKCKLKEIPRAILAQVKPDSSEMLMEGDEKIAKYLRESLKDSRYLIVLDDVWDTQVWLSLESLFPYNVNENRVLLTTRLQEVSRSVPLWLIGESKMRLLNKEESWDLLREKVFAEEFMCPPQLEKAGKKIAENCDGLPLTIVTVANLLSKAEKTTEYWSKVAAEKENSLFMDAYDEISKVLIPSYEHLPQHLKVCFLYMGVFPQNFKIRASKLFNLWSTEGILEHKKTFITSKDCAVGCLEELISNSLGIVYKRSTLFEGLKTCGLHSSFRHLCKCNREAGKNKFFHVLKSRKDGLAEGIKSQRRLCIYNNTLFGIKDVYNSIENNCASTARSLLCFGPHHQYPKAIRFGLRLLRVLDLTICFYEFPKEILKLVQLRYLALTYNGKLPASISKLWNLQFLIIHRPLRIKSSVDSSYLPIEIWDLQELKHLQIMGSNLPDRPNSGALLPNLLTLLGVNAHSCTKGVLENIPNLQKLGIRIELAPDVAEPLCCFDHISHLEKLESLKCVIVNPELRSEVVAPPAAPSIFPSGLRKLTLNGLGYPWEYMNVIGSLPNLEVLKLRCYAFRGPKWEIEGKGIFRKLKILLIEDSDLVQWKVGPESFPRLTHLRIRHCYKLEELQWDFNYSSLFKIEVVDYNPSVVTYVKQIEEAESKERYSTFEVYVHSSWDDGKDKS